MKFPSLLLLIVKHWEESCRLTENMTITITPVEESLIELLQLGASDASGIDANWLRQTEQLIAEAIIETQKTAQERQEDLTSAQLSLREQVGTLQSIVGEHHKLMNDVRLLLRSMAKQENVVGLQVKIELNKV